MFNKKSIKYKLLLMIILTISFLLVCLLSLQITNSIVLEKKIEQSSLNTINQIIDENFKDLNIKSKESIYKRIDVMLDDISALVIQSIVIQIVFSIFLFMLLIYLVKKQISEKIIDRINCLLSSMKSLKSNEGEYIVPKCACDDELGVLIDYYYKHITQLVTKLHKKANYDSLTQLYSRQKLISDLGNKHAFNLAILDIDKFKDINNFLGIKAGDELIKLTARYLQEYFKNHTYSIYRFNGDEFAILEYNNKKLSLFENDILAFLDNISKKDFKIKSEIVNISLSAGVTNSDDKHPIVSATTALKYTKKEKLSISRYSEDLPIIEEFKKNFNITKIVRKAISKDLIVPHFQAIKDIKKDTIIKYEALMRITDSKGTLLYPNSFLDVSQKSGLYQELSLKMIKKSIEYFQNKDLSVTINLSTKDIEDTKLLKYINKLKQQTRSLKNIVFEITEQDGIENFSKVNAFIKDVKSHGAKIAIDDFGSGYSNFENIIHLDIDFIKIDGSMIKNIVTDKNSQIIVETIVGFVKRLDIQTIAEYVSDEKIYEKIKSIGVDYAQGYFISKPLPDI
jgi:diguanylate cyclase (GGDEF)-like protein